MPQLLVIKTSSLGDILQTLPVVLAIKKAHPYFQIDWVCEKPFAPFLEEFSDINRVIVSDFKRWKKHPFKCFREFLNFLKVLRESKYHISLDFQGNVKSGLIQGFARAVNKRGYDFKSAPEWPSSIFSNQHVVASYKSSEAFLVSLVKDLIKEPLEYDVKLKHKPHAEDLPSSFMLLGLGSAWPSKQLDSHKIRDWVLELKELYQIPILIPVQAAELDTYKAYVKGIDGVELLTRTRFADYIPIFEKAAFYVGVDSALLHLARLLKIPSVGLFGPSSKGFYGKPSDMQGECPYNEKFIKRCKKLRSCSAPCMKNLDPSSLHQIKKH